MDEKRHKLQGSPRQRAAATSDRSVIVQILRNPRSQAAFSGLTFFTVFFIAALTWVASFDALYQILVGFSTGFSSMAMLYLAQRFRKQSRIRRAVVNAQMARLNSEGLRRLIPKHAAYSVSFTNFDKLYWVNNELGEVWPFLGEAISCLVKEQLQLILDEYKMGLVEKMSVRSIVLGVRSPKFEGIKVMEGGHNEVILEAIFTWQTEKEDIVIDVKTTGPDFSLKITDIYMAGILKLVFKPLKEQLPGFGAILVSLVEDPDMGFNIKVMGGDVKELPGVDNIIDNTIRTAVIDVLVWPNRYVYPILPGDYSYLDLRPVGVLDVSLIEATDLMNTDILGKSDPFALLFVRLKTERIKRSSTKKNTLHPVWNEGFYIEVDDLESQYLTIRMMDDETVESAEYIGAAKYPLQELEPHKPKELWLDLVYNPKTSAPEKTRGKVHLLVIYKPFEEGQKRENASKTSEDTQNHS
eukprot:Gb_36053 [translate_table: standard]